MKQVLRLILSNLLAALSGSGACWAQSGATPQPGAVPTSVEMEALVRSEWPYFSAALRSTDALTATPTQMTRVPHTLCSAGYDGRFFDCATLIVYMLPNGRDRSTLVRHPVERNSRGQLQNAIVTRGPEPAAR